MKKSGLADSPFFAHSPPSNQEAQPAMPVPSQPLFHRSDEQTHERTDEQTPKRTPEQVNIRTDEHLSVRTDEQTNKRTDEHPARIISRQSYNIYDDQAEAIEILQLRRRKERGRHITKGEIMRELLDKALQAVKRTDEQANA